MSRFAPGPASQPVDISRLKDASLSYFVAALSDPLHPKACSVSLKGALTSFPFNRESAVVDRTLVQFYEKAMAFLVAPQTSEDVESVLDQLGHCRCLVSRGSFSEFYHLKGKMMAVDPETNVTRRPSIDFVCFLLTILVMSVKRVNSDDFHGESRAKSRKKWPMSLQSLLPISPRRTVTSLALWHSQMGIDTLVLQFLNHVTELGAETVILEVRDSEVFKDALLSSLSSIVDYFKKRRGECISSIFYPTNPFFMTLCFIMMIVTYTGSGIVDDLPDWLNDEDSYALASLTLESYRYYPHPNETDTSDKPKADYVAYKRAFLGMALDILENLHFTCALPPDLLADKSQLLSEHAATKETSKDWDNNIETVVYSLSRLQHERKCFNATCPNRDSRAGSKAKFSLCSRCQVMGYCSKECQSADWKDEKVPHKTVCKKIITLKTACRCGGRLLVSDDFDEELGVPAVKYLLEALNRDL